MMCNLVSYEKVADIEPAESTFDSRPEVSVPPRMLLGLCGDRTLPFATRDWPPSFGDPSLVTTRTENWQLQTGNIRMCLSLRSTSAAQLTFISRPPRFAVCCLYKSRNIARAAVVASRVFSVYLSALANHLVTLFEAARR